MNLTLRTKLIILSTLLVTIVMGNVTYFFTIRELHSKRDAVESQIEGIARNIATMQLLDRQDWGVYQNFISQLMISNDDIVYIAVFDDRRSLRAHTLNIDLIDIDRNRPLPRRMQADIVRRLDRGAVADESSEDLRSHTVNIQVGDRVLGSVHVGFSLIDINRDLRRGIVQNVVLALIFLVVFSLLSTVLSRRLTRPLERLSIAMGAIAEGNLEQKVGVESRDEIGQLAQTFNEMVEGLRERRIIESLGHELSATFQLDLLATLVRDRLRGAIGAAEARLYLCQRDEPDVYCEVYSGDENGEPAGRVSLDQQAQSYLAQNMDGFMVEEAPPAVQKALSGGQVGLRELAIPMLAKGQLLALLFFTLPGGLQSFDNKRKHFAATLAGQAALALENALLYDKLREQERLKRELEIAHEVQHKLLPREMPDIPGFQFEAMCRSAQEVGGDYFDFFRLDDGHLGIVIADVSGKGTSASFYMAEIKGMMLTLSTMYMSPKDLLIELNRRLYASLDRKVFATMIYGVVDVRSKQFTFARAGHSPLLRIAADGRCEMTIPSGIGLGLESGDLFDQNLKEEALSLDTGDFLILFTDGITDAMNGNGEIFGVERLLKAAGSNNTSDAARMCEGIFESVEKFVNGARQHDDLAMVIVQCRDREEYRNR